MGERELAEQMTVIESDFYNRVLPKECIGWNKKDKETLEKTIFKI